MNDTLNKQVIVGHEGLRLVAYRDTRGNLTVGFGFNLEAQNAHAICAKAGVDYDAVCAGAAITPAEAYAIFDGQYALVASHARNTLAEIDAWPDNAGAVITDMIFNLGWAGFLEFHQAVAAFRAQNYPAAIAAMKNSAWAHEVPARVENDVTLLEAIRAN